MTKGHVGRREFIKLVEELITAKISVLSLLLEEANEHDKSCN